MIHEELPKHQRDSFKDIRQKTVDAIEHGENSQQMMSR